MAVSFRQAEKHLYTFPVKLMRWQELLLELFTLRQETDCHAQSYEAIHAPEGTHSEPVASYYAKIEAAEKGIVSLGRDCIPIMRLRNFLKISQSERYRTMYSVMELFYFERWKLSDVSEHLRKSIKTIARRRHELVDLTREELERGVLEYEFRADSLCYVVPSKCNHAGGGIHDDQGAGTIQQGNSCT